MAGFDDAKYVETKAVRTRTSSNFSKSEISRQILAKVLVRERALCTAVVIVSDVEAGTFSPKTTWQVASCTTRAKNVDIALWTLLVVA
jgi:hypothetical protein